jgi:hypothetical protein
MRAGLTHGIVGGPEPRRRARRGPVRALGAGARPVPQGAELLPAALGQRGHGGAGGFQVFGGHAAPAVLEGRQARDLHHLLELGRAVALGLAGQPVEGVARHELPPGAQVDLQDGPPLGGIREVEKEDLIEAARAEELGRERLDPVGRGDHEDRCGHAVPPKPPLLEPRQERADDPARHA